MQPSVGDYCEFTLFVCVLYSSLYITNHLFCYPVNTNIVVFDFVFVDMLTSLLSTILYLVALTVVY